MTDPVQTTVTAAAPAAVAVAATTAAPSAHESALARIEAELKALGATVETDAVKVEKFVTAAFAHVVTEFKAHF